MRRAEVSRKTNETDIVVTLDIDGSGKSKIHSPIGLLNHMLELFAFHGLFDLELQAEGDAQKIDIHHTNEDIGIVLGQAFKKALGDKDGITRFGSASVPMEEVVACVTVDISGRGGYNLNVDTHQDGFSELVEPSTEAKEQYDLTYANHFFESFANHLGVNLNIKIDPLSPDLHTTLEPVFKAFGIAMDQATQIDLRRKGIPSTKGVID